MKPFTSASAPRQGGKPGRRVKLSGQALEILDRLMVDWAKHGSGTLNILRLENPAAYARLAIDVAPRVTLNDAAIDDGAPSVLIVKWVDPKRIDPSHPVPLPPDPIPSTPPPVGPARATPTPPPMLTLIPRMSD